MYVLIQNKLQILIKCLQQGNKFYEKEFPKKKQTT